MIVPKKDDQEFTVHDIFTEEELQEDLELRLRWVEKANDEIRSAIARGMRRAVVSLSDPANKEVNVDERFAELEFLERGFGVIQYTADCSYAKAVIISWRPDLALGGIHFHNEDDDINFGPTLFG